MKILIQAAAASALLLTAPSALARIDPPPTPAEIAVFEEDDAYVFRTGESLPVYTFDKDPAGKSVCVDECAKAWPPVAAPAGAKKVGDWTPVQREGSLQWAYKGKPVYTYAKDDETHTRGDGVGGVWKRLKP